MIDWAEVKPAILSLVKDLIGLETVWEDEPRPFNPGALCLLSVTAVAVQGSDERRIVPGPDSVEIQDLYVGNRLFTLTIKVESLVQEASLSAYQYLERARGKFEFRSTTERIHLVNCAIGKTEATVDLTAAFDDRNRSIAALDVHMAGRFTVLDPDLYPYIATAAVTGTLQGA
jgi:hypothetical protein